jgi:antitoxin HicB
MSTLIYPALFMRDDEGRFVVTFPDLPGAITDGATLDEAMREAIDCLGSDLAHRLANRKAEIVPRPGKAAKGATMVPAPLWIAGKIALHWAMEDRKINNVDLAKMLGVNEAVVRRMLDPDHETKAEKLISALAMFGKYLVVQVRDAA